MRVAIVMAAGRSRRFVGGNKLLARVGRRTVVRAARDAALAGPVGRVIVVVGHDAVRVARQVRHARVTVVTARDHRRGASASLKAGLRALWPVERRIFLFLGDMPAIPVGLPARLSRALRIGDVAVRPRGAAGPGHPVLLRRPDAATISGLHGDRGLGAVIAGGTRWIDRPGRYSADIDTRRDLACARRPSRSSPVRADRRR